MYRKQHADPEKKKGGVEMELRVLKGTLIKNLLIQYRAYPMSF